MKSEELSIERYFRRPLPTVRDLTAIVFRQRRVMIAAFILVVIAVLASGLWVPKYSAQMKILVRRQRPDNLVTTTADASTQINNDQISEEDLNTEVELLKSDDLLRKVVLQTGLANKDSSPGGAPDEVHVAKAVRKLAENLKIEPLHKSNVISVEYQVRDPKKGAEVLQALSAAYLEKHLAVHRSNGEFNFFDQQTKQYQQKLEDAQKDLTDFTKESGVVSAEMERDSALRLATEFDSTAHQAQTAVNETEQRVHELQQKLQTMKPRMTTVVRTSDNPQLFEQLKSTLLNLELKRTELLSKYDPSYRPVQEVEQQIADAKAAIQAEENKPLRDETSDQDPNYLWVRDELTKAQADLSGLRARASAAAAAAAQYHGAAERLDQKQIIQQDLLRAAKTQEENYLLYVHKREEARINDALDRRGILNVAMAEEPIVPALPNRTPINAGLLMLLIAGTFSFTAAFVADFLDPSFRTPDELASYLGTPVLAALPKGED